MRIKFLVILLALVMVTSEARATMIVFTDFVVPADAAWVDSGVPINVGDILSISATGSASRDSINFTDPDGIVASCNTCIAPVPNSRYALVGRIGIAGDPFLIGSTYSEMVFESGALYLGFNDTVYSDNAGSFLVSGTVVPEPSTLCQLSLGLIGLYGIGRRRRR